MVASTKLDFCHATHRGSGVLVRRGAPLALSEVVQRDGSSTRVSALGSSSSSGCTRCGRVAHGVGRVVGVGFPAAPLGVQPLLDAGRTIDPAFKAPPEDRGPARRKVRLRHVSVRLRLLCAQSLNETRWGSGRCRPRSSPARCSRQATARATGWPRQPLCRPVRAWVKWRSDARPLLLRRRLLASCPGINSTCGSVATIDGWERATNRCIAPSKVQREICHGAWSPRRKPLEAHRRHHEGLVSDRLAPVAPALWPPFLATPVRLAHAARP